MIRPALLALIGLVPPSLPALTLDFPAGTDRVAEDRRTADTTPVATGPWTGETVPLVRPEGEVTQQAWRIGRGDLTTLQILNPLAAQLEEAGYEILFRCRDRVCGGFDFRYALEVLPAPEMSVSLGDYRYLSARREEEHVAILVSRTSRAGFVQVTRVGPERPEEDIAVSTRSPAALTEGAENLAERLESAGRVVLSDIDFATGSAQLGAGLSASLTALADYLAAHPERRIALVGHTDASGALQSNIALSRRRAESVMARLVTEYGVSRSQLAAEGTGYLTPLATNLTEEGREANRRVEAVLTVTE
ncbi:OmpA family protein [Histidinibacterium aquaticum]|uniref:OmpA family protein n=1 Tax=Histidinibacterium aquaticum TaxID=2613962 RepID=A0A5J5GFW5_9RHOB|nr:OmpA family protein [Histidinibacterium aquaticum]KAA9007096.1 OmpA family protein [Histidinibacterium aquaticum]